MLETGVSEKVIPAVGVLITTTYMDEHTNMSREFRLRNTGDTKYHLERLKGRLYAVQNGVDMTPALIESEVLLETTQQCIKMPVAVAKVDTIR